MTTKDKLMSLAAQLDQLAREIDAIGKPVREGGASDISFAASHTVGVAASHVRTASVRLVRLAGTLP